ERLFDFLVQRVSRTRFVDVQKGEVASVEKTRVNFPFPRSVESALANPLETGSGSSGTVAAIHGSVSLSGASSSGSAETRKRRRLLLTKDAVQEEPAMKKESTAEGHTDPSTNEHSQDCGRPQSGTGRALLELKPPPRRERLSSKTLRKFGTSTPPAVHHFREQVEKEKKKKDEEEARALEAARKNVEEARLAQVAAKKKESPFTVFLLEENIVLSGYFVVLPLRDEGAISLGIGNIPGLFLGSLMLTLIAAPLSTLIFSLPNLSKPKILGFFNMSSTIKEDLKVELETQSASTKPADWDTHGWFYISVALLNLITISSTWARVADVMDNESGSRLFGFIGAGATFGQLFGSLFATGMAWLGPYLLLFASLMMEFAAQSSKMINKELSNPSEELRPLRKAEADKHDETNEVNISDRKDSSPTASIIASTVTTPTGRRRLFAEINSFIAVFILAGQLTLTGRILTVAGITIALCAAPFTAFLNSIAIAVWPTYVAVAISETVRKVCIDVLVQRFGDATAAGMYKLLHSTLDGKITHISLYALPVCVLWDSIWDVDKHN
ncbi:hypothetical protein M8C21_021519, partial [Ambrosia artemisiifolia]